MFIFEEQTQRDMKDFVKIFVLELIVYLIISLFYMDIFWMNKGNAFISVLMVLIPSLIIFFSIRITVNFKKL